MTTTEVAHRLLRHCSVTDIAALTLSQATEIMSSLSVAVGTYFRRGPAVHRQTSATVTLPAPRIVSGLTVAANALEVSSGSPFRTAERGATLLLSGDENRNEVVSSVGWLNPYMGTAGTKTATVYGDCAPIGTQLIEQIKTDPIVLDQTSQADLGRLVRVRDQHDITRGLSHHSVGRPEYYAILPTGVARGATSQFIIRVWPLPERPMLLRFEADVAPDMFDALNVTSIPLDLPFSDDQMETIILPMAEREMLASTLMDEVNDRVYSQIEARAQRAEGILASLPRDQGRTHSRIYTRRGW
jgi:hypothetical protein